jgi:hypothetical protein
MRMRTITEVLINLLPWFARAFSQSILGALPIACDQDFTQIKNDRVNLVHAPS